MSGFTDKDYEDGAVIYHIFIIAVKLAASGKVGNRRKKSRDSYTVVSGHLEFSDKSLSNKIGVVYTSLNSLAFQF